MLPDILDLQLTELTEVVKAIGLPTYAAGQLSSWLYQHKVKTFDAMTNIAQTSRNLLKQQFRIGNLKEICKNRSHDGTTKWLFGLDDGESIETVMIPSNGPRDKKRRTVCISTQVGCAMGCRFCHTGTMGLHRHLRAGEIIGQVLEVARHLAIVDEVVTNVVFMGMGEPLHNYSAVVTVVRNLTAVTGIGLGHRRVTISTVGLVPEIRRLAAERLGVKLALSLHATTDNSRAELIPTARKYPLAEIISACHDYARAQSGPGSRVTLEYLLLRGVNDSAKDCTRLAGIAGQLPSKVNVIPFNSYPGSPWGRPEPEVVESFVEGLRARGVQATVRQSRGMDILAACGQLATKQQAEDSKATEEKP